MPNKYNYLKVIQMSGPYGWEDVDEFDLQEETEISNALKEYRMYEQYTYRLIARREIRETE